MKNDDNVVYLRVKNRFAQACLCENTQRIMINTDERNTYVSPQIKTMEIAFKAIICNSPNGINPMDVDEDEGKLFG